MSCLHKYRTKDLYGNVIKVPCGSCINCRKHKRTFWFHRISYHVQSLYPLGSTFITCTIEDPRLAVTLNKRMYQKFLSRLREFFPNFKYVAIGDYGDKGRAHYHFLALGIPDGSHRKVHQVWHKGFVRVDPITSGRINYVVNYMDKFSQQDNESFISRGLQPPFRLFSRGIGQPLFDDYPEGQYFFRGSWYAYPSYWRAKHNSPKPIQSIESLRIRQANAVRNGFTRAYDYEQHQSWIEERNSLHRDQMRGQPPQGLRHLPDQYIIKE